ncbi:MAG: DUF4826 family protein [Xanthomonadales bacterium]|nr:DUF4826 family protein [Xanthomonadales bacterium]
MNGPNKAQPDEKLNAWVKQRMDGAVRELMQRGVVEDVVVEAKPAWVFPFTLLIGRIRDQSGRAGFDWFICGDAPLSHVDSKMAATPREAARHFALQWQLDATRAGEAGADLVKKAEALYELVQQDALWQR